MSGQLVWNIVHKMPLLKQRLLSLSSCMDLAKSSCASHLVAAELHAAKVVPLYPDLTPLWHARRRPAVDWRGQQAQCKPLLGRLRPSMHLKMQTG